MKKVQDTWQILADNADFMHAYVRVSSDNTALLMVITIMMHMHARAHPTTITLLVVTAADILKHIFSYLQP